jgi:hypothetical protein
MRALAIVLAILLVMPVLASAKSVAYVTNQSVAGFPCTSLTGEDKLFCQRLEKLGYHVDLLTDSDVRDNSLLWQDVSPNTSMIFLGGVSAQMVNLSLGDYVDFCGHLAIAQNEGKKIFATFVNARKKGDVRGCAFNPLNIVSFPADDNTCTAKQTGLWVIEDTYITRGFQHNQIVQVYNSSQDVWIHGGTQNLAANCDPPAASLGTSFYSAVAVTNMGTFWGLDKPSAFTSNGWLFFDRTVLLTTGDNIWNVSFFTIPELITANRTFMLFAQVSNLAGPVTNDTVTVNTDSTPLANLTFNNVTGRWENRLLKIANDTRLNVTATDGSANLPVKAGELGVQILSSNYQPGTYTIRARLEKESVIGALNYKLWNSNLAVISEGPLGLVEGTYKANVELSDLGGLILEVTATTGDGMSGGAFKTIHPQVANITGVRIEPASWVVTATSPGADSITFRLISPSANITGLDIVSTGELAPRLVLNLSGFPSQLMAGSVAEFSAKLNWSSLPEGIYKGELLLDSDQLGMVINVTLNRFNIPGDFLTAEPKTLGLQVPFGGNGTATIKLTNGASLPATSLKLSVAGTLAGRVSMSKNPYTVPARGSADLGIAVDAKGLAEGTYSGVLKVTSSLGEEDVILNVIVGPDVSKLVEQLEIDYSSLLEGKKVPANLQGLSQNVNSSIEQAKDALARGDFSAATNAYRTANTSFTQLQTELAKSPPFDIVSALFWLIVIGAIAGGVWYYLKRKKEKEEERKKKPKLPEGEEKYRFEYY